MWLIDRSGWVLLIALINNSPPATGAADGESHAMVAANPEGLMSDDVRRGRGAWRGHQRVICGEDASPGLWIVAGVLLVAAAMVIAGLGEPAVWFAIVAIGVAVVVVDKRRSHHA